LKAQYEEARRLGVPLLITFINDRLPDAKELKFKARFSWKEWSEIAEGLHLWIGKCKTGFDGGADLVHRSFQVAASERSRARGFVNESAGAAGAGHQTYSLSEHQRAGRVKFAESNECRAYLIGSLPSEFIRATSTGINTRTNTDVESLAEKAPETKVLEAMSPPSLAPQLKVIPATFCKVPWMLSCIGWRMVGSKALTHWPKWKY